MGVLSPPIPPVASCCLFGALFTCSRLDFCFGYYRQQPYRHSAQSSPFPPLADMVSVRLSALGSFTKNSSNSLCEHLGYGGEAPHIYALEALGLPSTEPLFRHRRCRLGNITESAVDFYSEAVIVVVT